jgi:hypothetical protein
MGMHNGKLPFIYLIGIKQTSAAVDFVSRMYEFLASPRCLMHLWKFFGMVPVEARTTGTVCTWFWCRVCFVSSDRHARYRILLTFPSYFYCRLLLFEIQISIREVFFLALLLGVYLAFFDLWSYRSLFLYSDRALNFRCSFCETVCSKYLWFCMYPIWRLYFSVLGGSTWPLYRAFLCILMGSLL